MKTLAEIITELQAVEKTELDAVVAAINTAVADLQAFTAPTTDPVITITVTTQSGAVSEFVPKA